MAIAQSDGSIILSTRVDTSGIKQGMQQANKFAQMSTNEQRRLAQSLAGVYRKQGMTQSEAQKKAWQNLRQNTVATKDLEKATADVIAKSKQAATATNKWGKQTEHSAARARNAMIGVGNVLRSIAGYLSAYFGVYALIKFGKEAINLASDLQEVQNVVDVAFGGMSHKIEEFAETSIEQFGISELTAKRTASTYMAMAKGMGIVDDVASDMAITMTGLTADLASFYNISQERADTILKSVYTGETEALKQLGIVMTEVNLENFAMSKGITKNLRAMTQQEKTMLRYQFVLEQTALAQGDFARTQDSWANQTRILTERWKEMQRVFGEAFMTIGTLILPTINNLISGLTQVAHFAKQAAAGIYEMFTGKKYQSSTDSVKATAQAQKELTEEVEETAEALDKSLAGFDDLQILASQAADSFEQEETAPELPSIIEPEAGKEDEGGISNKFREYADAVISLIAEISTAVGGALIAVGLLMLVMGNVTGGLALMATGALLYATGDVMSSDDPLKKVQEYLDLIKQWIVPALIGIGVLMLFLGQIPIGIGLILAGVAYWGYKEVQSGDYDTASFQDKLNIIMEAVSLAMVGIGVMLIFLGHVPLGLGFIVAGKHLLGVTEQQLNEGGITTKIQQFINENQSLFVGVSLALVVLSLILFAGGIFTPISLGLLVAGATGLVIGAEMNGETVPALIQQFFEKNIALVVGVSSALVVLGIVLIATGVGLPFGIAMIASGAIGLVAEAVINWEYISTEISDFITKNSALIVGVSLALLVIGIILIATGFGIPVGIALIAAGAVGIVTEAVLNWEYITQSISNFINNNSQLFVGVGLALIGLGIILLATGVGIPLAIGLIVAGGASLAAAIAPNWNFILDKVKETWTNIKNFWNTYIAYYFTAEFWGGLAKALANGFIGGIEMMVNNVISMIESMVNSIVRAINAIGRMFGIDLKPVKLPRISIPRLAQGAVIPPNREFLAVLGDQKHGTNIEAPLDTIVEAFNMALNARGSNGNGSTEVILELDGQELGRAIIEQGDRERRRIGTRLVVS